MKKIYGWWMILCCLFPLLAILLLPVFGVRSESSIFFLVLTMFVCHFMMIGGHGKHDDDKGKESKKEGHHGCH